MIIILINLEQLSADYHCDVHNKIFQILEMAININSKLYIILLKIK